MMARKAKPITPSATERSEIEPDVTASIWHAPSAWRRLDNVLADVLERAAAIAEAEMPILTKHWPGIAEEFAARQHHQRLVDHQPERAALTRHDPAPSAPSPAPSAITMINNER